MRFVSAFRKAHPSSGKRRRRVVPLWRSRWLLAGVAAVALAGAAAGGAWLWHTGWVGRTAERAKWEAVALAAAAGLEVEEILVIGRRETRRDELIAAVRLAEGAPIFTFDPEAARRRIEALPWVRSAVIERRLPSTVFLHLIERKPLALWQSHGRFSIIGEDGGVIEDDDLGRFADLLLVVGEGAPKHTAALLAMLETQPDLRQRVKAAVWVGGRRWNLRLDNGIDVRLPETDAGAAWARLARYEHIHHLFARDVELLDLRIPDRLIVRRAGRQEEHVSVPGEQT